MKLCPAGATVEGIDVSVYQGKIDWSAVRRSGRAFAFIRVSDGLHHLDALFEQNWKGARDAGLLVGAYQFFRPSQDGAAQAKLLLDRVGRVGGPDLPSVLDAEEGDGRPGIEIVTACRAWLDVVAAAEHRTPIVYTGSGFWDQLPSSDVPSTSSLWTANWTQGCPLMPAGWDAWEFWQYSSKGSVPGIGTAVDLDRFNGSLEELRAFAGTTFTGAPTSPTIAAASAWPVALAGLGALGTLGAVLWSRRRAR